MTYLWKLFSLLFCIKDKPLAVLNDAFDESDTGYIVCDV